jgi:hypothetical protein
MLDAPLGISVIVVLVVIVQTGQCDLRHARRSIVVHIHTGRYRVVLGYGLIRPSDAQVVTGFELVTRT